MDWAVLLITLGSFAASFVNAAFATGGVYIMLFTTVSVLPISAAIPLQSVLAAASLVARIGLFWQHINWPLVRSFVFGSLFGVYLGTTTFAALPDRWIALLLGLIILALIWAPQLSKLPKQRPFVVVGVLHSYLGAAFGIGGVLQPMILRTDLVKVQITGTLAACLLCLDVMKVTGYVSIGFDYFDFIPHIIGATLAGFAGTLLGKRVTHRVSETLFRTVFRALASLIALRFIAIGFLG